MMAAVETLAHNVGTRRACKTLGVCRATLYRRRAMRIVSAPVPHGRPSPPRALSIEERLSVVDTLHSPRFIDKAPHEVYATLLDEGSYLCSIRTMYRILDQHGEVEERRNQLSHPPYQKPELLATGPNQVWSWDITKLLGPVKWSYYYLYVILDIFSRYVVGWMLASRESEHLAERLIRLSGKDLKPVFLRDRGYEIKYRSPDVTKLKKLLGEEIADNLEENLGKTYQWYLDKFKK